MRIKLRRVTAVAILLAASGCGTGAVTQGTTQPVGVQTGPTSLTSSVVPSFASDDLWRDHLGVVIPQTKGWDPENLILIAKSFCHYFDQQPRLTESVIDIEISLLLKGPSPMSRDLARVFLSQSVAQYCPEYNATIAAYHSGG